MKRWAVKLVWYANDGSFKKKMIIELLGEKEDVIFKAKNMTFPNLGIPSSVEVKALI